MAVALLRKKNPDTHCWSTSPPISHRHTLAVSSHVEDQRDAMFPTKICSDKSHSSAVLQTTHQNIFFFRFCSWYFYSCSRLSDGPRTELNQQVCVCLVCLFKVVLLKANRFRIAAIHHTECVYLKSKQHVRTDLKLVLGLGSFIQIPPKIKILLVDSINTLHC